MEKQATNDFKSDNFSQSSDNYSEFKEEKSIGVLKAEILANQWQGWFYKTILLISAFIVGYAYGLDSQTRYVYNNYAVSSYSHHSLISTISVVSSVASACAQPVFARLSDVFGRLEIFLFSALLYVIGTIISSQAHNVQNYAAGSVFYSVGYAGVILNVLFIVSDFSSLRWRWFYNAVPTFPFIINTWISGDVTAAVGTHWSWGVGMWAFIFPLASIPLVSCMLHMRWKAGKTEEWKAFKQRKTKYQELGFIKFMVWLFWKLDVGGLILLAGSFGCLLVPITLASGFSSKWRDASLIVPMIIGGLLFPAFLFWESKVEYPIAPVRLMRDRGIWSALYISFSSYLIFGVEGTYLYTVLIVSINESMKSATRITSLYSFVSTIGGLFLSLTVVYIRRLKPFIVFGVCMCMVALGIMLKFRAGTGAHAGVIAGQVLYGFGACFFTYPTVVSLQACVSHEHMAVMISLAYTVFRLGSAVGSAISGAVWNNILPPRLAQELGGNLTLATIIYGDPIGYTVNATWGTPVRESMVRAYRHVQFYLILSALCICVPMIFASLLLRDNRLGDEQAYGDLKYEHEQDFVVTFFKNLFGKNKKEEKKPEIEASN